MARTETPVCDFGLAAPDFRLPGVDGKTYSLQDVRGPRGLLVMFICNQWSHQTLTQLQLICLLKMSLLLWHVTVFGM